MMLALATQEDTLTLARRLAALAEPGDVITLRGTLGTGKTTFARTFIRSLCPDAGEVVSPTFSLLQTYSFYPERSEVSQTTSGDSSALPRNDNVRKLWHMDLYRLKSAEEALELGIEDGFGHAILLIEWPEVTEHLLPAERLDITLDYGSHAEERMVRLQGTGKWTSLVASL